MCSTMVRDLRVIGKQNDNDFQGVNGVYREEVQHVKHVHS